MRVLTLILVILVQIPLATAAVACPGADLAMTSLTVGSMAKDANGYLNDYRLVAKVTNVGDARQASNVLQFVDFNQYGARLDDRGVPPLRPGESYVVTYVWRRSVDAGNQTSPMSFHLRVSSPLPAGENECNSSNDARSIQF